MKRSCNVQCARRGNHFVDWTTRSLLDNGSGNFLTHISDVNVRQPWLWNNVIKYVDVKMTLPAGRGFWVWDLSCDRPALWSSVDWKCHQDTSRNREMSKRTMKRKKKKVKSHCLSRNKFQLTSPRRLGPGEGPKCCPLAPKCCTCQQSHKHTLNIRHACPSPYGNAGQASSLDVSRYSRVMSLGDESVITHFGGHPCHLSRYSTLPCRQTGRSST